MYSRRQLLLALRWSSGPRVRTGLRYCMNGAAMTFVAA